MSAAADSAGEAFREHLMRFVRTLRGAGLRLGPGDTMAALEAAAATGIAERDDLRRALAATLVRTPSELPLFREAFRLFFEAPAISGTSGGVSAAAGDETATQAADEPGLTRLAQAIAAAGDGDERRRRTARRQADRSRSASGAEVLRHKDFEQMTREEAAAARDLVRQAVLPLEDRRTRRFVTHPLGRRPDLRATLRRSIRDGGETVEFLRRRRRRRPPPLVLLCDISGSMSRYTRMFLYFAHALTARQDRVHTFLFGTRLSPVTRRLRDRDPDRALALVANDIGDWDGGTRITESLHTFNRDWGRRVLGQGAVVLMLTDGLERGPGRRLGVEMERLARSSRRLVWLNPLLRYADFRPVARGMQWMLPHVHDLVPAHNVTSLEDLATRLRAFVRGRRQSN